MIYFCFCFYKPYLELSKSTSSFLWSISFLGFQFLFCIYFTIFKKISRVSQIFLLYNSWSSICPVFMSVDSCSLFPYGFLICDLKLISSQDCCQNPMQLGVRECSSEMGLLQKDSEANLRFPLDKDGTIQTSIRIISAVDWNASHMFRAMTYDTLKKSWKMFFAVHAVYKGNWRVYKKCLFIKRNSS